MATRAAIELELSGRVGVLMTHVGMAIDNLGSNTSFNDAIRRAIVSLGGTIADGLTVTDADLSTFEGVDLERLLDVAELRLLWNIWGAIPFVDQSVGQESQELSQLPDRIMARIKLLESQVGPLVISPLAPGAPVLKPSANARYIPNDPFSYPASVSRAGKWPYP